MDRTSSPPRKPLPQVGVKLDSNPFENLDRDYRVLEWYDGPLLSCARFNESDQWYVVRWADVDDKYNRWIIYDVTPEDLEKISSRSNGFSCREVIARAKTLHLVDIDNDINQVATYLVTFGELDAYGVLPDAGATYGVGD